MVEAKVITIVKCGDSFIPGSGTHRVSFSSLNNALDSVSQMETKFKDILFQDNIHTYSWWKYFTQTSFQSSKVCFLTVFFACRNIIPCFSPYFPSFFVLVEMYKLLFHICDLKISCWIILKTTSVNSLYGNPLNKFQINWYHLNKTFSIPVET